MKALVSDNDLVNLDIYEVKEVLTGKSSIMFEAQKEDDEDKTTFMNEFFTQMSAHPAVKFSSHFVLSIGIVDDTPLMMEDMTVIHEFMNSKEDENMTITWGIKRNAEGEKMSLVLICSL